MRLDKSRRDWWRSAVFYQIYPKSFQDSNGDGTGDLPGILSRLDYLERLGIDGIWLSPIFASPQVDNGYDISDYQAVDPMFGSMEDLEALIREGKKRGISIILDLVLNHTSDQHFWFQEARKSRENPYHNFYVWRDGEPGTPPNDMIACFGGPAWTWVPEVGQYYFHQFAPQQPDLNWENPQVREALYGMIRFWMDKGIEGFRLDVIDQIAKEPDRKITANGPQLHPYLRELSRETFQRGNVVTVGEAWGADVERAKVYSAPDGSELSMVFQFEQMGLDQLPGKEKWDLAPLSLDRLKESLEKWQLGLAGQGWNSLFWNNHDLPRIVSRWGDDGEYRVPSAKLLAILLHGLQGTPYIYQGEELGMTNAQLSLEEYRDVESLNCYRERTARGIPEAEVLASLHAKSRDNARTPMQWTAGPQGGFTTGEPWIQVNPNHREINAQAALADPDSIFYTYQKLIALRKAHPVFREGDFHLLDRENKTLFSYTRETAEEGLLVVCNFCGQPQRWSLPQGWEGAELAVSSYPDQSDRLRPWEGQLWLRRK